MSDEESRARAIFTYWCKENKNVHFSKGKYISYIQLSRKGQGSL